MAYLRQKGMFRQALIATISLFILSLGSSASAQSAADYARLNQDVALLAERLGKVNLRVSVLERENEQLRKTVDAQVRAQRELNQAFESYTASIDARLASLTERERSLKNEILSDVSVQIRKLGTEFQKAIDALAKAQGQQPTIQHSVSFDNDYPEQGVSYEVKSGDTLSGIARKLNSTIRDIQNANQIANPQRDLKVGDIIFVPQSNP
ncbi:LysM peptidoglycan-binding domain-containing protein [Rubellicoccus peritrichatus]|uniref:LysM peptidoglycan-binding domain-containing protein n=1 Tax=Rubellicoccus peritrichatus TaxID=3080537 RepID=A0AAQ3LB76_9BACT|nr:LysM peptidoglycan-binding domain-containing protein [Puniceicoccus sp. CR14]WOO40720.1 LysM peptidoglycan-binding domain-containing protein [Puniceicoccus sp. CR14]